MNITDALRDDFDEVKGLLKTSEGRRVLTAHDPLLFARVYFPHHLKDAEDNMTVCDFHLDLLEYAESWSRPSTKRKGHRACFIAPRQSGKSTWIFLLLPMWAAAHEHRKFVAAFSDSEAQAITHLHTFKMELLTNDLLRADFPELCAPMKVGNSAKEMLNNRNQILQSNGFIFMAKGADSAALGMKLGATRPDVLLFDDIEPGESNYSEHEARKRKETLLADLFPLNDWAVVAIVGTTTMPNSLIDQMRKVFVAQETWDADEHDETAEGYIGFRESIDSDLRWVLDENIKVHYWPVIVNYGTQNEESLWPERWSMEELNNDRHTRAFAKNMMNRPISLDGGYWDEEDIDIDSLDDYKRTIICVDPAVTTNKRSDFTGIAVLSVGSDAKVYVRHAEQVKMAVSSDVLGEYVAQLVERFGCQKMLIETNQGGDLWKQTFKDVGCKLITFRSKEKKEIRAAQAVDFYKKGQVKHTGHFYVAEEQMLAFPHVSHDDVVDAIVTGVLAFRKQTSGVKIISRRYANV